MYFIGSVIMLFAVALACYVKDIPLHVFANPFSTIIILFTFVGIIVSTSNFKTFIRGLNAILSASYTIDDVERKKATELFRLLSKSIICVSFVGFLLSLITLPFYQDDTVTFRHAFSAAIACLSSGLILSLVFFEPAVCVLKKPRVKPAMVKEYPKYLGDRLLELCSQNGLTAEDIQQATTIDLKHD